MIRKFLIASMVLAVAAFAFAETQVIKPTKAPDTPDAIAKDATEASVDQTVKLIVPQATALHLDASTLTFDITKLDGDGWADRAASGELPEGFELACVYSLGPDVTSTPGSNFWNQTQTMPGGTKYDTEGYPDISITGEKVVNYPPLRLDSEGELEEGSKSHIVCYQSFMLQIFSNFDWWDLQVSRNDTGNQPIEHLYVQGNTCQSFGTPTGLYALNDTDTVHLIPKNQNAGTTGDRAKKNTENCGENKSWLDIVGVLAVKVNSDKHGTSTANLTYTLVSSDDASFPTGN